MVNYHVISNLLDHVLTLIIIYGISMLIKSGYAHTVFILQLDKYMIHVILKNRAAAQTINPFQDRDFTSTDN